MNHPEWRARFGRWIAGTLGVGLFVLLILGSAKGAEEIVVYSGRNQPLVGELFERFTDETGIDVAVRYGDTAELAATIQEEGRNTPADVYFAQDAGALGALAASDRLQTLPDEVLSSADARFVSSQGNWIGTSGRARTVVYNTDNVDEDELPDSIWEFTHEAWNGRIGWAPTNGSFQAFVTALRVTEGEARAEEWLRGILANQPRVYRNNTTTVDGVGRGEVDVGFVNHYYLFRFLEERGEGFPAGQYWTDEDAGSMVNIAGVGILDVSARTDAAQKFVRFLLSPAAQEHFARANHEYPLAQGVDIDLTEGLRPLDEIGLPDLDLNNLADLEGTLDLLFRVGAL